MQRHILYGHHGLPWIGLGWIFYVLFEWSISIERPIVWNLVWFLLMLLLFKTVWVFALSTKMIEFCFFSELEHGFSFCWMSASWRSLVITQHHPILITWGVQAVRYHLVSVINTGEIHHLFQINGTKNTLHKEHTCVKAFLCQNSVLSIDYNDGHILPLDGAHRWQKHTLKNTTAIQLFRCTPHIVNVIMDVWSGSWEPLACMINNRSVRSLESSRVVLVGCLAGMRWGLEAAMVYVVSRSDISGSSQFDCSSAHSLNLCSLNKNNTFKRQPSNGGKVTTGLNLNCHDFMQSNNGKLANLFCFFQFSYPILSQSLSQSC